MKSSPKQTDYPIYSEGKLSERKQLFHLSLRNRLPALRQTPISESDTDSQNDERQALKRNDPRLRVHVGMPGKGVQRAGNEQLGR